MVSVGLLSWRLWRARPGRAALLGFCFGWAWLTASVWWLFISMHRFGGLPAPVAGLALLLLCAALSALLSGAMATLALGRSDRPGVRAASFGALWLLAELARGHLFSGFPWAASGYAHLDGPLAILAPWIGVYGMGFVAAMLAAWVAFKVKLRPLRFEAALAVGVVLVLAWLSPQPSFTSSSGSLKVSLLQPNVAQDEKFAAERMPEALEWLASALQAAPAELVVAPETAVPLLPDQLRDFDARYWPQLLNLFGTGARAAMIGLPLGDYERGYTNSVVALTQGAAAYRYDKSHLVPFGEVIPTGFRWFTELMDIPLGDFARGPVNAASFEFRGQRIAPNICYEDLFGEELAQRFTDAATAPTVLINVSNIGWFGDTIVIGQHLNISRLRSLELQRPMLRATNTGATAAVDHKGRVLAQLTPFTRGRLDVVVEGRRGVTPYAAWAGQWRLWPLALLAGLVLLLSRFVRNDGRSDPP